MKTKEQEIKEIENNINSLFKDFLKALLTLSSGVALGVLLSNAHAQNMAGRLKRTTAKYFHPLSSALKPQASLVKQ